MPRSAALVALLLVLLPAVLGAAAGDAGRSPLEAQFLTPPDQARPWVYWFWMGGYVTREGITADLEAMARVGIGGVLIMNVQQGLTAPQPAVFMSDQWRTLFHHAVAEADRLGLQVCMHNCDGWMGSGGPWITPEHAMQQITWSETGFQGPGRFTGVLPQPASLLGHYRDIATLAVPVRAESEKAAQTATVTASATLRGGEKLVDGDRTTEAILAHAKPGETAWLQWEYPRPVQASGMTLVQGERSALPGRCALQVSDDGHKFREVCQFQGAWHQDHLRRSVTVAFARTTARVFRIVFAAEGARFPDIRIAEIELLRAPRIHYWEAKAGFCYFNEHGGGPGLYAESKGAADVPAVRRAEVLDLTKQMDAEGRLAWDAPQGDWVVLRIGHTANGRTNAPATDEGRGPACDKLDAAAMDVHFQGMVAKLIKQVGPLAGKAFSGVEIDSWECGIQNWTPRFREEFRRRRGYDPLPLLLVLTGGRIVDAPEASERFLWDVRRTIADLMAENYYGRSAALCRQQGLTFFNEGSGRQQFLYDPIAYQRWGDLPMGEFWMGQGGPRVDCKVAASVSHIYDKPIAGAEAFTSSPATARWLNDPFALKQLGDEAFCMGINQFIFHRYAHQPWIKVVPGMTMGPWGIHFERTNTWWEQGRAWLGYLARCQYLLQQGQFVADVCYFTGEDVPNYLGRREELHPPLPAGYDYDGCDAHAVLQMSVDSQGRIALPNGMRYRVLLLADRPTMTLALLRKVRELVAAGATVLGPKPLRSPSLAEFPNCDEEVRSLAAEVWGDCDGSNVKEHRLGKGRVVWGRTFAEVLAALDAPPDFEYQSADTARLCYIHRRLRTYPRTAPATPGGQAGPDCRQVLGSALDDTDIYFVASAEPRPVDVDCTFRAGARQPELWDPSTGRVAYPGVFQPGDGRTRLPLSLDPFGSVFVVFRKALPDRWVASIHAKGGERPSTAPPIPESPVVDNNRQLTGNFTMAFWARPQGSVGLPPQAASGIVRSAQNYVICPAPGHEVFAEGHAGAGVAVGTNGVCVVEHGARHMAPLLVHPANLAGWTHVTVVYRDGRPSLYLDGVLAREGLKSAQIVHPSLGVQHGRKVPQFAGQAVAMMLFDRPLDVQEIAGLAAATRPAEKRPLPKLFVDAERILARVEEPGRFDLKLSDGTALPLHVEALPPAIQVAGPWKVSFAAGGKAPHQATFEKLVSWTERPEEAIRYFSGTARYTADFDLPFDLPANNRRLVLDLGQLKNLAEVTLNGQDLGLLWKPPFSVDVGAAARLDRNRLEVAVTNLWPNRLIGDDHQPDDCDWGLANRRGGNALRKWPEWLVDGAPRTSGRTTFSTWKHWTKDDALLPSGLLGPVLLRPISVVEIPSR